MNLLEKKNLSFKSNAENSLDSKDIVGSNDVPLSFDQKYAPTIISNQKIYKSIIILSLFLFTIFTIFIFNRKSDKYLYNNYFYVEFFDLVSKYEYLYLDYMIMENNQMRLVINADKEQYIYQTLFDFQNFSENIKLNINNSLNQFFIDQKIDINKNKNFNDIHRILNSIDNLDIEAEIINNNLVAVGEFIDFIRIFSYLQKVKYDNFEFDLRLIKYNDEKKYYKFTIK